MAVNSFYAGSFLKLANNKFIVFVNWIEIKMPKVSEMESESLCPLYAPTTERRRVQRGAKQVGGELFSRLASLL